MVGDRSSRLHQAALVVIEVPMGMLPRFTGHDNPGILDHLASTDERPLHRSVGASRSRITDGVPGSSGLMVRNWTGKPYGWNENCQELRVPITCLL